MFHREKLHVVDISLARIGSRSDGERLLLAVLHVLASSRRVEFRVVDHFPNIELASETVRAHVHQLQSRAGRRERAPKIIVQKGPSGREIELFAAIAYWGVGFEAFVEGWTQPAIWIDDEGVVGEIQVPDSCWSDLARIIERVDPSLLDN